MTCGICNQRRARRACPALGRDICPACCGSKRLIEIACPEHCAYLASAQQHPAAPVRRQHEADLRQLLASTGGLTEGQFQLFFLVHACVGRFTPDTGRMLDADVADAAGALAATYETASRGLIYEHQPQAPVAMRLAAEIRLVLDDVAARGGRRLEAEIAEVLRAVERGARGPHDSPTGYQELVARVLREGQPSRADDGEPSAGQTIILT